MNPVSGSMLSTMAMDSRRTPAARSFAPPGCMPFSIAMPTPTSSAPACFTVGEEIVHDEDFIGRLEVRARNENVVELFVREGVCLGNVFVIGAVDGLALLGKNHGHVVQVGDECRDGDTACLDGEHLIELDVGKTAFELFANFLHQADVNLVV